MKADLSQIQVILSFKTGMAIVMDGQTVINKGKRPVDRAFAKNVQNFLVAQATSRQGSKVA